MQLSSELFERIVGPAASAGSAEADDAPQLVQPLPVTDETGAVQEPNRPSIIMPAGARVVERRQVRRTRFGQRVNMCPEPELSTGLWDKVMLQDISVAGLSFLSDRWLDVNLGVHLILEDRTGHSIRFRCVVKRCERGGMGGVCFTVGLTFDALLTDVPGGVAIESTPGTAAVELMPAGHREEPVAGLLAKLKPRRLLAAFTRNYDDYSTVSLGRPPGR